MTSVLYSALRVNMASLGDNSSSLSSPVDISSKVCLLLTGKRLGVTGYV